MRRYALIALSLSVFAGGCETVPAFPGAPAGLPGGAVQGLSIAEIDAGLREALTLGTQNVAARLGQKDGYFLDPRIRIPLPPSWRNVQTNLARIGASAPLDDLEMRLNRAAEAAIPQARTLVIGAVREMTIEDARAILRGGDTAATDFLRRRTETQLRQAFTPHVQSALEGSGAFTAADRLAGEYGLAGATTGLRSEITGHTVGLALDGLFLYVAEEEKKIRENPLARTSDLLRRVFGAGA
jgi:hypothetical protein